jgi:hypothetical protein
VRTSRGDNLLSGNGSCHAYRRRESSVRRVVNGV